MRGNTVVPPRPCPSRAKQTSPRCTSERGIAVDHVVLVALIVLVVVVDLVVLSSPLIVLVALAAFVGLVVLVALAACVGLVVLVALVVVVALAARVALAAFVDLVVLVDVAAFIGLVALVDLVVLVALVALVLAIPLVSSVPVALDPFSRSVPFVRGSFVPFGAFIRSVLVGLWAACPTPFSARLPPRMRPGRGLPSPAVSSPDTLPPSPVMATTLPLWSSPLALLPPRPNRAYARPRVRSPGALSLATSPARLSG